MPAATETVATIEQAIAVGTDAAERRRNKDGTPRKRRSDAGTAKGPRGPYKKERKPRRDKGLARGPRGPYAACATREPGRNKDGSPRKPHVYKPGTVRRWSEGHYYVELQRQRAARAPEPREQEPAAMVAVLGPNR